MLSYMDATLQPSGSVPSHSLTLALGHVAAGGVLAVPSYTRWIVIDSKTAKKFEKAGTWLLKEDGEGYRIRQGKRSVYVFAGQLKFTVYK